MALTVVEHALDMRRERHIGEQVLGEQPFAFVEIGSRETHPGFGEAHVSLRNFGETQQLQRLQYRKQIVDLHLQLVGQGREICAAVVGFRRQCLN